MYLDAPSNRDLKDRFSDDILRNIRWIIRIQAFYRGHLTRKKVQKMRDERAKSLYFADQDFYETISEQRLIMRALFYPENERTLQSSLVYHKHQYERSGNIYEGQWLGGFRHGEGKIVFSDGAKYEGQWVLGRAHG